MTQCPECHHEITRAEARFCDNCGFPVSGGPGSSSNSDDWSESTANGDESADSNDWDSTGELTLPDDGTDRELNVQSNTDLVRDGITDPAFPAPDAQDEPEMAAERPPRPEPAQPLLPERTAVSVEDRDKLIRRLGELAAASTAAASTEPTEETAVAASELEPTSKANPVDRPKMATRVRGVAYFYRNFIQVAGHPGLHPTDDFILNDRNYELRPKTVSGRWLMGATVVLLAVVAAITGSLLLSGGDGGSGGIIGIALDANGQPYLRGASIRLVETGLSVTTNAQGFFKCEHVPAGSHKIEYVVDGKVVATDFATVTDGEITTLFVLPDERSHGAAATGPGTLSEAPPADAGPASAFEQPRRRESSPSEPAVSKPRPAKLSLAANVENARLAIDGQVVGAGNITYANLSPGAHSYEVAADGYQSASGTITLNAGKTSTLEITLVPITEEQKRANYGAKDYYLSAVALAAGGDYDGAVRDFSAAIERQPSYAEAYEGRAEANRVLRQTNAAYDDFIRAAEIFRTRSAVNQAITNYNKAIDLDQKSVAAYLGRGQLYLAEGQAMAAIADFDAAQDLDPHNPQIPFELGKARFSLNHYDKAIKHFREARSLDNRNPAIYQYLMLSYLAVDDHKQVKKAYEQFMQVASPQEIERFKSDTKYSAVIRLVED